MSEQIQSVTPLPTPDLDGVSAGEVTGFEVVALPSSQEFATRIAEAADKVSVEALPLRDVSASWGAESPDISLDEIPSDLDTIRDAFLQQESSSLAEKQWWAQLDDALSRGGASESERSDAQQLIRAHSFDMHLEGHLTGEKMNVYECGGAPQDALTEQELDDLKEVLTVMDQLGSGALLKSEAARTLVFLEGVPLMSEGKRRAGLATPNATYIDVSLLREGKQKFGAEFGPLLGGTLVHELLGHQLERLVTDGEMDYFEHHFHYSDEKVPHEQFGLIHSEVTSKDSGRKDSKPVRQYGYVNNREDSATSTEAVGIVLMDWEQEYDKIPAAANTVDEYRSELVTDFLRQAAHWNGRPKDEGIATPVTYVENEATGQLEVRPARVFKRRELDKKEIIAAAERRSLDRLNKELSNKTEIRYSLTSSLVW